MVSNPRIATSQGDANRALLAAYSEVCKSYHAIDEFRMKLLGLLPLASLAGLLLLDSSHLELDSGGGVAQEVVGFAAIFASALTLALFSYEVRGIRRCHDLVNEGIHIEKELGIGHGQFHVCAGQHTNAAGFVDVLNAKFTACAIYSLVFAGWLFIALRFGFGMATLTCSACATGLGLLLALGTYKLVSQWTAA